eukprot:TRINITY_DN1926_c0_g1_i1.p2 TRINITY_DN1926_c0_g1~~TRINITY_DN1926_c0_g1_i1.p2  ORF type:complete len:173 (+),score=26.96 TRINITY_DN1926_c0_g1_i1:24-542(+)
MRTIHVAVICLVATLFAYYYMITPNDSFSFFSSMVDYNNYNDNISKSSSPTSITVVKYEDSNGFNISGYTKSIEGLNFMEVMVLRKPFQPQDLLLSIIPWVIKEPTVPINTSCTPPSPRPTTLKMNYNNNEVMLDCTKYPTVFTGNLLNKPRKIVHRKFNALIQKYLKETKF